MFNNPFGLLPQFNSHFSPVWHTNQSRLTHKAIFTKVIIAFTILILLTACNAKAVTQVISTPEANKGNVIGIIQSTAGEPYKGYSIRLAEVYWQGKEGAYVLDESFSPGAISDDNGAFQVLNAPEGEYVLIISEPLQTYKPVTDSKGVLQRVKVNAGETIDLGTIKFDYQP